MLEAVLPPQALLEIRLAAPLEVEAHLVPPRQI